MDEQQSDRQWRKMTTETISRHHRYTSKALIDETELKLRPNHQIRAEAS